MFVIKKLILQDLKVIKKLLDLLKKKDKVFQSFFKLDGLILIGNFIQKKSNTLGGVIEQEVEQRILAGDLTTSL